MEQEQNGNPAQGGEELEIGIMDVVSSHSEAFSDGSVYQVQGMYVLPKLVVPVYEVLFFNKNDYGNAVAYLRNGTVQRAGVTFDDLIRHIKDSQ